MKNEGERERLPDINDIAQVNEYVIWNIYLTQNFTLIMKNTLTVSPQKFVIRVNF